MALAGVLAFSASALADSDQLTVRLTASGQRLARAAIAGDRDFAAPRSGWVGRIVKPNLHEHASCGAMHAKQSDLVLLGRAESTYTFKKSGWQIDTDASVLRTPEMVVADWKRTGTPKQLLACIRAANKKSNSSTRLVSAHQSAPFRMGDRSEAFRALLDVRAKSGKHVRVAVDFFLVSVGRTEIILTSTARADAGATVVLAEVRLARILAQRAADAQHITLR